MLKDSTPMTIRRCIFNLYIQDFALEKSDHVGIGSPRMPPIGGDQPSSVSPHLTVQSIEAEDVCQLAEHYNFNGCRAHPAEWNEKNIRMLPSGFAGPHAVYWPRHHT